MTTWLIRQPISNELNQQNHSIFLYSKMKNKSISFLIILGLLNITSFLINEARANDQLSDQERSAVSVLASITDIVMAKIEATSCYEMKGQYPLKLFATGIAGQRRQNNMATVKLTDHAVSVAAYLKNKVPEVGSQIITIYTRTSDYNLFDPVKNYDAIYSFNSTGSVVSMVGNLELFLNYSYLKSQAYSTEATISFSYAESGYTGDINLTNIGSGTSQLSTVDYQKAKYQQRVTITKDDGTNAHTVLVRDLLANRRYCRIKTELVGHNSNDLMSEDGYLTVDMSTPDDPLVLFF